MTDDTHAFPSDDTPPEGGDTVGSTGSTKPDKPGVDWAGIRALYRTGLNVSENARRQGEGVISRAGINKRAKRDGWDRDLASEVQRRTESRQNRKARPENTPEQDADEEAIVEESSDAQLAVIDAHKRIAAIHVRHHELLLEDFQAAMCARDELADWIEKETAADKSPNRRTRMMKLIEVPNHAATHETLIKAYEKLQKAMRLNVGLKDELPTTGDVVATQFYIPDTVEGGEPWQEPEEPATGAA